MADLQRCDVPALRAVTTVGLGFRARKGGAVVVGIAFESHQPRVVFRGSLETCAEGERLSLEPYRVAAECEREPQGEPSARAAAVVANGRRRQDELAVAGLRTILRALETQECKPVIAALLINRAGWITDVLQYSLAHTEHVPVAEGLAVRDALRFAFERCRLEVVELDEKSLPERAAATLDASSLAIDERLKSLRNDIGKPWRKEQKLACLAAWCALAVQP